LPEFISICNKHARKLHGLSGKNSLDAVWQLSFESLDPQSFSLLGVMSILMPDSIPQYLFESEEASKLPSDLASCADEYRQALPPFVLLDLTDSSFSEVIEQLLTLVLIK
jgi:hypothetical protein